MQKIYINKETNMVEQILTIKTIDELPDDYFPNCYSYLDIEDKINAYNLRYNKESKEFEVLIDVPAKDEVIVEENPTKEDFDNLKQENEDLKARLDKLESLIMNKSEVV